ncbi:hypothetical protein V6N12_057602 [Hibiscus sabdariffa]|uniref:R13L1/DRL21-like LRR repeat region domain-containing protein n=1 Tax=Hibiscus sabdariffa TaxID=183260 RepID=A0ABR2C5L9_9ROSI
MFVVDKDDSHSAAADLSKLGGFNNLRGRLEIANLGFVTNAKLEFKAANLKKKKYLRKLDLLWSGPFTYIDDNKSDYKKKSLEDL